MRYGAFSLCFDRLICPALQSRRGYAAIPAIVRIQDMQEGRKNKNPHQPEQVRKSERHKKRLKLCLSVFLYSKTLQAIRALISLSRIGAYWLSFLPFRRHEFSLHRRAVWIDVFLSDEHLNQLL